MAMNTPYLGSSASAAGAGSGASNLNTSYISTGLTEITSALSVWGPVTFLSSIAPTFASGESASTGTFSSNVTIGAYYQFEWRKSREPGSGSYFSDADYLDEGGERFILSPGTYLFRARDQKPSSSGQFGIALQVSTDNFSYGLYALRFNELKKPVS